MFISPRFGAEEACWAHNPEVGGSKPPIAYFFSEFCFSNDTCVVLPIGNEMWPSLFISINSYLVDEFDLLADFGYDSIDRKVLSVCMVFIF